MSEEHMVGWVGRVDKVNWEQGVGMQMTQRKEN